MIAEWTPGANPHQWTLEVDVPSSGIEVARRFEAEGRLGHVYVLSGAVHIVLVRVGIHIVYAREPSSWGPSPLVGPNAVVAIVLQSRNLHGTGLAGIERAVVQLAFVPEPQL
jgi:hypothetical protein